MAEATLSISSRNYSSWSLRGWLICKLSGLDFDVEVITGSAAARAELLHLSPSFLVPRLVHGEILVWDTLAIAGYLEEIRPYAGLLPKEQAARAWCRAISGEMHQGFANLRSALPMNLKARHTGFKVWGGALSDINRVVAIWTQCIEASGGPWLFGEAPTLADAMFAPVATRFASYDVSVPSPCGVYRDRILSWPLMREWIEAAVAEPEEIEELDMEF